MEAGLLWFEELCSTFTVDPQAATAALLLFRNSDGACGHCMHFITASSRGDVKFQALLALKYAMVKNWNSFTPDAQTGFHVFLWGLILDERPREPYVLNTLIQLYALFVKKCWMSDSADKRSLYFHSIAALHSDGGSDSISRLYVAAKVLRGVIECMFDVDALDTGFSHADNVFIRRDFIRCVGASSPLGLTQAVAVSMSMLANMHQLTAPFDLSVHGAQHSPVVSMLDTRLIDLVLSVGEVCRAFFGLLLLNCYYLISFLSRIRFLRSYRPFFAYANLTQLA